MDTEDRVINRRSEEAPVGNCKDCPDRERVDLTHKADNIITALNTLVSEVLKGKAIVTSNMTNFQVTLQEIDSELTKFDFPVKTSSNFANMDPQAAHGPGPKSRGALKDEGLKEKNEMLLDLVNLYGSNIVAQSGLDSVLVEPKNKNRGWTPITQDREVGIMQSNPILIKRHVREEIEEYVNSSPKKQRFTNIKSNMITVETDGQPH